MATKRVTIKTLAEILGVKPATISKALHAQKDGSEETKKKVRALARQLGYRPNLLARGLVQRQTRLIGALVPEFSTSFFHKVIKGFYRAARKYHYHVMIMVTEEDPEEERACLDYFISLGVDGILLSVTQSTIDTFVIAIAKSRQIPLVLYDRIVPEAKVSTVTVDDLHGAAQMAHHLMQKGYKRLGYIGPVDYPSVASERYKGFQKALASKALVPTIFPCKIGESEAFEATIQLLESKERPDALFCANDLIALGAYRALSKANIKIPHQIALAGFGNIIETELFPIPISTVQQPALQLGECAVELLIDEINHPRRSPRHIQLETELVIRAST